MRMPPFELHTPSSLDEALSLAGDLQKSNQDFDWVAGGTDLLPNYKWHLNAKPHVISLAGVPELSELSETHIGAMVRLQDLADSEAVHPLVAKASSMVASVMIRRSGTASTRGASGSTSPRNGESRLSGVTSATVVLVPTAELFQTRTLSA